MTKNFETSVIAKLRKGGKVFEILVDCDLAMGFKKGDDVDIRDVVLTETVFSDAKKGIKASLNEIKDLFGSEDLFSVCSVIIKEGQVSLTAEYMRKEREVKKRRLISLIVTNAIEPKSGRPHPPQRIETALSEAKFKIDDSKSVESQVKEAISAINTILPIKYGVRKMEVKIPTQYTGRASGSLRQYCNVLSEKWENDGGLIVKIEIPLGMQEKFESVLNNLTKGDVETKNLD